ncbi:energy-coupling factor ABC transporter permease [Persephonella sp.]|nr:cobalamin biosynthesis protein CbiM [Aquificota bacterium]
MHIPDGFISPKVYIPAYVVTAGLWAYGFKKLKDVLDERTLPFVAVMTAFSFVISLFTVPLPGGTSGHAVGVGLLSVAFGYWVAFVSLSVVFFLQAVLFGDGGITTFPINAFSMGFVGGVVAHYSYRLFGKINDRFGLFVAGWLSVVVASLVVAVILGIQPVIAHTPEGKPLFFPFGIEITLPAVVVPHLIVGIVEGIMTVIGIQVYRRLKVEG